MASCHTHAPTKLPSHRSHRIHRSFWCKIFSHRLHGCAQIRRVWHPAIPTQPPNYLPTEATESTEASDARYSPTEPTEHTETTGARYSPTDCGYTQIRRVWHPCHTHAANQTIFPQNPTQPNHLCASVCICGRLFYARSFCEFRDFRGRTLRSQTICEHLCASVGGSSTPEASVNSVNSVGEPYATTKLSVLICAICGRIIKWAAWVWQGCHTLLSVLCWRTPPGKKTKRAWRNAMPSYVSYVDAWVWQGCHTLL